MPRGTRDRARHRQAVARHGPGVDQGDVDQPRRRTAASLRRRVPLRAATSAHPSRLPRGHARLRGEARAELDGLMADVIVPGLRFDPVTLPYEGTIPDMLRVLVAEHGANDLIVATTADGSIERITYAEADAAFGRAGAHPAHSRRGEGHSRRSTGSQRSRLLRRVPRRDPHRRGRGTDQHVLPGARARLAPPPRRHPHAAHRPLDPWARHARSRGAERARTCRRGPRARCSFRRRHRCETS